MKTSAFTLRRPAGGECPLRQQRVISKATAKEILPRLPKAGGEGGWVGPMQPAAAGEPVAASKNQAAPAARLDLSGSLYQWQAVACRKFLEIQTFDGAKELGYT